MVAYQPLEMFKKATSFLYREIGILKPFNHHEVCSKRSNEYGFFENNRKRLARELYHNTNDKNDPQTVLTEYEVVTGLTLEDIYCAFDEGNWKVGEGKIHYGGPKWAIIAETTIKLRDALIEGDKVKARELTLRLETLEHNNGQLVDKFGEL